MRPRAGRGDLAAPEPNNVDAILSRANLARLRGDYAGAMNQIQGVLSMQPQHVEANSLMGDVLAEAGDWDAALLYYRMSEDHGGGPVVQKKRKDLELRLEERSRDKLELKLGLAKRWERVALWTGVGLACLALTALVVSGLESRRKPKPPPDLRVPIVVTDPVQKQPETGAVEPKQEKPKLDFAREDQLIREALVANPQLAEGLRSVIYEPRTGTALLSFELKATENPLDQATRLAEVALLLLPDVKKVTTRVTYLGQILAVVSAARGEDGKVTVSEPWPNAAQTP